MSRSDLDRIQDQLKVAIQDHQGLVSKMTSDPQNVNLQVQLHELQSEIRNLSEKQKSVVEQLRKEILAMQVGSVQQSVELNDDESLPSQTSPTDLSYKQLAQPSSAEPTVAENNNADDVQLISRSDAKAVSEQLSGTETQVEPTPLIKVPDFGAQKPSDEQNQQRESISKTSRPVLSFKKPVDVTPGMNGKTGAEKKELTTEEKRKLEYMASLSLITVNSLKELQTRRSERKRKSMTNPHFWYGNLEAECGISATSFPSSCTSSSSFTLNYAIRQPSLTVTVKPDTKDFVSSTFIPFGSRATEVREDCCTVCHRSGELLMCDVCSLVYHLQCLDPPLTSVPVGLWSCPKCQALSKQYGGKDDWPGTLALVHSYLMHKAAKEEEKKKMQKLKEELAAERSCLEEKAKRLREVLAQSVKKKGELVKECSSACQSLENLRNFIRLFNSANSTNTNHSS